MFMPSDRDGGCDRAAGESSGRCVDQRPLGIGRQPRRCLAAERQNPAEKVASRRQRRSGDAAPGTAVGLADHVRSGRPFRHDRRHPKGETGWRAGRSVRHRSRRSSFVPLGVGTSSGQTVALRESFSSVTPWRLKGASGSSLNFCAKCGSSSRSAKPLACCPLTLRKSLFSRRQRASRLLQRRRFENRVPSSIRITSALLADFPA